MSHSHKSLFVNVSIKVKHHVVWIFSWNLHQQKTSICNWDWQNRHIVYSGAFDTLANLLSQADTTMFRADEAKVRNAGGLHLWWEAH